MKKRIVCLCMGLLFGISLFSACAKQKPELKIKEPAETEVTATESEAPLPEQPVQEPEPEQEPEQEAQSKPAGNAIQMPFAGERKFCFSSGMGGWLTEMTVTEDGLFRGHYQDIDMGSGGDGYRGTQYFCDFVGYFDKIEKVDDYSYRLTLGNLNVTNEKNEEWIENETLYVPSSPYGMENCEVFFLYVPGTNVTQFPEDFLTWWPTKRNDDGTLKNFLDSYAIHNTETGEAFFSVQ